MFFLGLAIGILAGSAGMLIAAILDQSRVEKDRDELKAKLAAAAEAEVTLICDRDEWRDLAEFASDENWKLLRENAALKARFSRAMDALEGEES